MSEEIKIGYHIRVRLKPSEAVVIHGPTENWQHRPRVEQPKHGFWRGPFASKSRAEQVAYDLADELDYDIELCKICYHGRQPDSPTRGEAPAGTHRRGKRIREYAPPSGCVGTKSRRRPYPDDD